MKRKLVQIARVFHEANRAVCRAFGDDSQKPWDEAEEWQRESTVSGVEFALNHPEAEPSAQHESWSADKLAAGWKFGPVKDPAKKEHPCLIPFDQLPPEQKAKDYLLLAIVRAMTDQPVS